MRQLQNNVNDKAELFQLIDPFDSNLSLIPYRKALPDYIEDTKHIRPFDLLYNDYELVFLLAPYGSGKTNLIQSNMQLIKDAGHPVFIFTPRIVLNYNMSERLEIETHYAINAAGLQDSRTDRILTIESLPNTDTSIFEDSFIFIDEAKTLLKNIFAGYNRNNLRPILEDLRTIIRSSRQVVFADANFTLSEMELFRELAGIEKTEYEVGKKILIHVNDYKNNRDFYLVNEPTQFRNKFLSTAKKGATIYLPTDSISESKKYFELCQKFNIKALLLNSETSEKLNKELARIDEYIVENKFQVVIFSPSGFVGISLDKAKFDFIFAHFTTASCSWDQLEQGLHRPRDFNIPIVMYVKNGIAKIKHETDWKTIYSNFLDKENFLFQLTFRTNRTREIENEFIPYVEYMARNQAEKNKVLNIGVKKQIVDSMIRRGAILKDMKNFDNTPIEFEKINSERLADILAIEIISKDKFQTIQRKNKLDREYTESLQAEKYLIADALQTTSNEIVNRAIELTGETEKIIYFSRVCRMIQDPDKASEEIQKYQTEKRPAFLATDFTVKDYHLSILLSDILKELGETFTDINLIDIFSKPEIKKSLKFYGQDLTEKIKSTIYDSKDLEKIISYYGSEGLMDLEINSMGLHLYNELKSAGYDWQKLEW
ncbi:MAG: DEAD/DEAH box helicase family protein [Leptospiraceae bacterium]|nr:DEAD/DEAH box helicase family protein [Leptospiraceae bacterium]